MKLAEYASYDATGLAQLVRRGEVSAADLVETARTAIEQVNAALTTLVDGPWERPLEHDSDGPFGGVPFVLKDIPNHAAGVPARYGTRLAGEGLVLPADSHLMTKFRQAGLAVLGRTVTPEFGLNANCEALAYGTTRNPWDTTRSVGGSSGGTAALVAAGGVPVGHANDVGGSIRIPAAYNGVVGLKPSRGRTTPGPFFGELILGFASEFVNTRTVRDVAGMLDALQGPSPGDRYIISDPARPYVEELGADPGRLRVAVHAASWAGTDVDPEMIATVEQTARWMEEQGHHVEEGTPAFDWEQFLAALATVYCGTVQFMSGSLAEASGLQPGPDTLEAVSEAMLEYGEKVTMSDYLHADAFFNLVTRTVGEFFTRYDVLITPAVNTPAPLLGYLDQNDPTLDAVSWFRKVFSVCSFGPLFNCTGTPAISLPLGHSSSGLPLGVQLAAPMCREDILVKISSQLETAMPWADRIPPAHVSH